MADRKEKLMFDWIKALNWGDHTSAMTTGFAHLSNLFTLFSKIFG